MVKKRIKLAWILLSVAAALIACSDAGNLLSPLPTARLSTAFESPVVRPTPLAGCGSDLLFPLQPSPSHSLQLSARSYPSGGSGSASLVIDTDDNIWIANYASQNVSELDSSGGLMGVYPINGWPMGIALGESGNVWTSNYSGDAITQLAPTGDALATYQIDGAGLNDLVVDKSGYVWATNTLSNTVVNIRPTGMITISLGNAPRKIATDKSGFLWIINEGSSNVMKLDTQGATIATYPVCNSPQAIAIDNLENVWVATIGGAVNKLSPSGELLGIYGASDRPHPAPHAVAADTSNNIWIANYGNKTVSVLSSSGKLIGSLALDDSPFGIAVDRADNIWVTGFTNGTITKISKEQAATP